MEPNQPGRTDYSKPPVLSHTPAVNWWVLLGMLVAPYPLLSVGWILTFTLWPFGYYLMYVIGFGLAICGAMAFKSWWLRVGFFLGYGAALLCFLAWFSSGFFS